MSIWSKLFEKREDSVKEGSTKSFVKETRVSEQFDAPVEAATRKWLPKGAASIDADAHPDFNVSEIRDDRRWEQIREASVIPETWRAGNAAEALRLAGELQRNMPDYYFGYYQEAVIRTLPSMQDYENAFDALNRGMQASRSKASLCGLWGTLAWEKDNLNTAVPWWIKSAAGQSASGDLRVSGPFLHLAYVAEECGLATVSENLRVCVRAIRPGGLKIVGPSEQRLRSAARALDRLEVREALIRLNDDFLVGALSARGTAAAAHPAQPVVSVAIESFGVYHVEIEGRWKNPNAASGFSNNTGKSSLLTQTDRIAARLGVTFGISIIPASDLSGGTVTLKVSWRFPEPGIRNSETDKRHLSDEGTQAYEPGESHLVCFTFDTVDEMLPGEWMIEIWYGNVKLAEKSFQVTSSRGPASTEETPRKARAGDVLAVPLGVGSGATMVERRVASACQENHGYWYCATHGVPFRSPDDASKVLHAGGTDCVEVWMCNLHGPETQY